MKERKRGKVYPEGGSIQFHIHESTSSQVSRKIKGRENNKEKEKKRRK